MVGRNLVGRNMVGCILVGRNLVGRNLVGGGRSGLGVMLHRPALPCVSVIVTMRFKIFLRPNRSSVGDHELRS